MPTRRRQVALGISDVTHFRICRTQKIWLAIKINIKAIVTRDLCNIPIQPGKPPSLVYNALHFAF